MLQSGKAATSSVEALVHSKINPSDKSHAYRIVNQLYGSVSKSVSSLHSTCLVILIFMLQRLCRTLHGDMRAETPSRKAHPLEIELERTMTMHFIII